MCISVHFPTYNYNVWFVCSVYTLLPSRKFIFFIHGLIYIKQSFVVGTFHMLASFPYTTAMLLTLFCWMLFFSVSFSSSETKPMNELSGVCAECVYVCESSKVRQDSNRKRQKRGRKVSLLERDSEEREKSAIHPCLLQFDD